MLVGAVAANLASVDGKFLVDVVAAGEAPISIPIKLNDLIDT